MLPIKNNIDDGINDSVRVFSAFCDETRLRVLELLLGGEKCAAVLLGEVSIRQSTLSHHMKLLVESGVVKTRKSGKWTYYSISESGVRYAEELLKRFTTLKDEVCTALYIANQIIIMKDGVFMNPISTEKNFTIMTDTSCDLPVAFIKEHGIEKLPITFDLDGRAHSEGYWQEISGKDFYDALRNGGVAKTSQINPETFTMIFKEYAKQGRDLLLVMLSSGLSGTYQSAQIALQDVKEIYPDCNIYPVDSISASVGVGLLTELAAKKRDAGSSAKETAAYLEEKKHSCMGLFTVDDLMYLHRGGRLGKLSAIAGSVLKIKPVLNLAPDGTLALKDKTRGRKASLELLTEQLKRSVNLDNELDAELDTVYISHTDCEDDANTLAEMVKASVNVNKVEVMLMGPVIGAHVGPGAIVLLFEGNMTRNEYEARFYGSK